MRRWSSPRRCPPAYRKGRYHGGQILRGNGTIHPGLYHAGLLERAARDGAQIVSHCPVQTIERTGSGFRISTPRGTVRAGHVIVATNGYTPKAAQWLRRRVVPVDAFMIATEPLPRDRVEDIAPGARPMLEHRYSPCWLRPNEDGTRILFGGLSAEPPADLERKARTLRDAMVHIVPALEGVKISHCWTGQDRLHLRHDAPHREPRRRRVRDGLVRVRACPWAPISATRPRSGCWATRKPSPPSTAGPSRPSRSTPAAPGSCRSRWRGTSARTGSCLSGSPDFSPRSRACVARDARGAHDAPRRSIRQERAEERSWSYG